MTILIFLIILSVLVIVHEAGHLFAAKRSGVEVSEFGIGFPPKIARLGTWRGTRFVFNALFFGGYVKMDEEGERKPLVLLGGVIANAILAWILFSLILLIGIDTQDGLIQYGPLGALWHGFLTTGKIAWMTIDALFHISPGDVVGPVGLVPIVGQAAKLGLSYVLYFAALISINLSIINLIPIPALDGGRLLIVLYEKWRGTRISRELFQKLNFYSFALLVLIMVIVTVRDVTNLI